MEGWIILYEFSILIYCISNYYNGGMNNSTFTISMVLSYICIKICYYIFNKSKYKNIILILTLILIVFQYTHFYNLIIIILPINIYMLLEKKEQDRWINILVILISLYFIKYEVLQQYLLSAILGYIVYILVNSSFSKIQRLADENEKLKEKNTILFNQLNKDAQFHKQLKDMSRLEERNKIAQEIHDDIGHTLSGSLMQLEAAKLLLEIDVLKSKLIIQSTIDVLRKGMENIRITLRNIKPPSEQLGINKLKLFISEFNFNSGIKTNFIYNGNVDSVTARQWKLIYDNTCEGLTNAMKYSKASKVTVNIEIHNKIIKLEVKDDGKGCSTVIKGLGIAGMEERVGNVGGQVIVDGSQGFSIISIIPLVEKVEKKAGTVNN